MTAPGCAGPRNRVARSVPPRHAPSGDATNSTRPLFLSQPSIRLNDGTGFMAPRSPRHAPPRPGRMSIRTAGWDRLATAAKLGRHCRPRPAPPPYACIGAAAGPWPGRGRAVKSEWLNALSVMISINAARRAEPALFFIAWGRWRARCETAGPAAARIDRALHDQNLFLNF